MERPPKLLQNSRINVKNHVFRGFGRLWMIRISTAAIALLAGFAVAVPASAQMPGMGDKETPMQKQERRKEEERKEIERDYDKTMKRLKGQGAAIDASSDPWAIVRPTAAPAKPEPKADNKNANKQR